MKYRKTEPIEATQWFTVGDHPAVLPVTEEMLEHDHTIFSLCGYIQTLESNRHIVTPGDWIAGPGPKGEYWAIKPDVFAATYEPVD